MDSWTQDKELEKQIAGEASETDHRTTTYDQLSALCAQLAAALIQSQKLIGLAISGHDIALEEAALDSARSYNAAALTAYRTL